MKYLKIKKRKVILSVYTLLRHILIIKANKMRYFSIFSFLVKNSTCFGQTYCPSSGVLILYSQQLVFVILVM